MKKLIWIISISIISAMGCGLYTSQPDQGYARDVSGRQGYQTDRGDMDMDYIYDYLEPYGNWIDMEHYGYVWTPRNMGYRWRPYSDGQWASTDYGWTWISREEWGVIPFHYGRWGYDNDLGWFWVPGTVWGPAWVSWRWSEQYVGWAPLPPGSEFRANVGFISLSFNIPNRFWVFLQSPHFMDSNVHRYALPYERNMTIINFTSIHHNIRFRNNRVYNEGIGLEYVQRATRRPVNRYTVRNVREPRLSRVSGRDVNVYRPNFHKNNQAKPKAYMNRDDARRKLNTVKIFEPRLQEPINIQKENIQKRQAHEKDLLRETQAQEIKHINVKRINQMKQINDRAKKEKIAQDFQRKTENLKKQHQVETQRLNKRSKQDFENVKRVAQERQLEAKRPIKGNNEKDKNKNKNEKKKKNKIKKK